MRKSRWYVGHDGELKLMFSFTPLLSIPARRVLETTEHDGATFYTAPLQVASKPYDALDTFERPFRTAVHRQMVLAHGPDETHRRWPATEAAIKASFEEARIT